MKRSAYLLFLSQFYMINANGVDANSGLQSARVWPISKTSLQVQGYVENKQVKNFTITNGVAGSKTVNKCFQNAPIQQPTDVKFAHVNYSSPPSGYNQISAWMNITNDGKATGSVEVKSLEIWKMDSSGRISLLSDDLFCKTCGTEASLIWGSMLQNKEDWRNPLKWALNCTNPASYPDTCTNPIKFNLKWNKNQWGLFSIPTVIFPTSSYPNQIFHPWTAIWDTSQPISPRPDAISDEKYAVRAVAKITGAARLQIGFDYYAPPGTQLYCPATTITGENCEGAISNWQCATPGWVTLTAGSPGIIQP